MKWLGRRRNDARDLKDICPTDTAIPCPRCGSLRAKASMLALFSAVTRANEIISVRDGARLACQQCGHQFSFDTFGVFEHDESAYPVTRQTAAQPEADAEPDTPTGKRKTRPPFPGFKARPE